MLVQVTNTGNAPESQTNLFDIAMPGSGVGYYEEGNILKSIISVVCDIITDLRR